MLKTTLRFVLPTIVIALVLSTLPLQTAETLPNQIADDTFWQLIASLSEPGGEFQSENFLSNETGFQVVIPTLKQTTRPDGVYIGVGPEQNFTYIAAIHPRIAFIVDIRRQNMLEHMIYKALFEMAADRAGFVSLLFSRKRPSGLDEKSTAVELFDAYSQAEPLDGGVFQKNLQAVRDLLLNKHKFGLTSEDQDDLAHVYDVFREFGPQLDYNSGGRRRGGMPNYVDLMTATDPQGDARSYLATEENYRFVRELETRNLIIPLTGDFGGPRAIRAVGQYLKDHSATVSAFYLSNVEQYLFRGNGNENGGWMNFYNNVATLPLDPSSTFIRSGGGFWGRAFGRARRRGRAPNVLASMEETLAAVKDGRIQTYTDVFSISR